MNFKLKLFQALLGQDDPYFIQVSSARGSVEFFYRERELRLLTGNASSWQDIILDDDATYHLRPGRLPNPDEGELIKATSIVPVMEDSTPPSAPAPASEPTNAEPAPPRKPVVMKGDDALQDLKTSIYGSSTIALDVDLIKSISKEAMPKSKPAIIIPINPNRTDSFWIGRSKECDLVIEENSVSRKHCQIDFRKGLIQLRDNKSSNGCYVNGGKVANSILEPGQKFFVGKIPCSVKLSSD